MRERKSAIVCCFLPDNEFAGDKQEIPLEEIKAVRELCDKPSGGVLAGCRQFNQGQFYACHDTLEALWMEASEPQRTLSRNSPNRCIPLSLKQLQLAGCCNFTRRNQ